MVPEVPARLRCLANDLLWPINYGGIKTKVGIQDPMVAGFGLYSENLILIFTGSNYHVSTLVRKNLTNGTQILLISLAPTLH